MDKLTVKGIGKRIDGDYDCDLVGMLDLSSASALTNREAHLIKRVAGVRGGEIQDSLIAGDTDVLMALGLVVLARHGVAVDEDAIWNAKLGALVFDLEDEDAADAEGDEGPPTTEGEETETPSTNGGPSGKQTSAVPQEKGPKPIGLHV